MINVNIWNNNYAEVEGEVFEINSRENLIKFIKYILDKRQYSGERICLESVDVKDGVNYYTEIDRWPP